MRHKLQLARRSPIDEQRQQVRRAALILAIRHWKPKRLLRGRERLERLPLDAQKPGFFQVREQAPKRAIATSGALCKHRLSPPNAPIRIGKILKHVQEPAMLQRKRRHRTHALAIRKFPLRRRACGVTPSIWFCEQNFAIRQIRAETFRTNGTLRYHCFSLRVDRPRLCNSKSDRRAGLFVKNGLSRNLARNEEAFESPRQTARLARALFAFPFPKQPTVVRSCTAPGSTSRLDARTEVRQRANASTELPDLCRDCNERLRNVSPTQFDVRNLPREFPE